VKVSHEDAHPILKHEVFLIVSSIDYSIAYDNCDK